MPKIFKDSEIEKIDEKTIEKMFGKGNKVTLSKDNKLVVKKAKNEFHPVGSCMISQSGESELKDL